MTLLALAYSLHKANLMHLHRLGTACLSSPSERCSPLHHLGSPDPRPCSPSAAVEGSKAQAGEVDSTDG